ncbi:1,2-dihydroxy-3-keto-5-methylthiopentene dioxygenase-like [Gigantopelta aegis]|uniref:1,2-dihydroxy-3-keto-5-methylthiopentene dioxygenase-like n=1 Tax=Gigantopelta aegis TaxID=1735272 RepID=UPI001B88E55A|nr:1,2-dihydroxy-3-keto-5-methylthiopentene dioxygenase-like [Gigantopelta aegis]
MVRAWILNETAEDQRLPHMTDPPQFVTLEDLKAKVGVLYWKLSGEPDDSQLAKIRAERGYNYEDTIDVAPDKLPDYDNKNYIKAIRLLGTPVWTAINRSCENHPARINYVQKAAS